MNKVAGLILAAGYSSRMGDFKPLLPFGKENALLRQINAFRRAGVQDVCVVVGHHAERLIPVVENAGAQWVLNSDYHKGMFSSVQTGVRKLAGLGCGGFFLLPVDYPLIRWWIIRVLQHTYQKEDKKIFYPCFRREKGHPPLISADYIEEIIEFSGEGGLRQVLARHERESMHVEVEEESVLLDMDTPEAYQSLLKYYDQSGYLEEEKCFELLDREKVNPDVIAHGKKVAEVAAMIGIALKQKGCFLNLHQIVCAGLLHDIAKGRPDHAKAGAAMVLQFLNNPKIAEIVGSHMELGDRDVTVLDEVALVYLADKLVRGTKVVSLEERLQATLEKFKGDPSAVPFAVARIQKAEQLKEQVEKILGINLYQIL
ncbi:MAG TPA: NTP transferase domain-containing protein [Clostridiales bacterium]|nr:NTP transferase domain-containing protein [Clostridiales bacterium]